MQIVSTRFELELKKRIDERIEDIKIILVEGNAVKDFADYRRFVGEYKGLKTVIGTFCDEVSSDIEKR